VSNGGRNISIQLGAGNGTFGSATMYPADQQSLYLTELAVGDFNGDGKLDVAAGAIIVPGNGDGTFAAPITTYTSGIGVYAVPAVADLNGDGKTDLIVAPYITDIDVLLNISSCAWPTIPTGVVATAITSTRVDLTWTAVSGATSYQVDRKGAGGSYAQIGTSATNSYSDTSASSNTAYLYRVRALIGGNASGSSAPDLATTVIFTDNPLSAGVVVKAAHLSQLRTAVGAVRTLAGVSAATFTDSASAGTTIKAIHVTELRAAADSARIALALANGAYTNATLSGTVIKAVHFQELRNRVQ
jgi:hypothetical protein